MNTYKICYQGYERGECPPPSTRRFEAPNDKIALLIASPDFSWGCGRFDPDNLDMYEKEYYQKSLEEMIEDIHACNGDGCDFLFLLENETSGRILFEDGDYTEQEEIEKWDYEIPEEYSEILL